MTELDFIEKLDASSILNKDIFYQLFAIEEDFERTEKYQKLEEQAEKLKVKTKFKSLYKAFEKDFKNNMPEEVKVSNVTNFAGQQPLECGMWVATDEGIWVYTEKGKLWACYHPIFPSRILDNIETHKCKVEIEYKIRNKWKKVLVDRSTIASRSAITQLSDYGIQVTSENAGALVQFLIDIEALNPDAIVDYPSTSRLGWIDGKFIPYESKIVFDNEQNLNELFNSIEPFGSREKWYQTIKQIRKYKRIETLMFLAASFASVLIEPCDILPFVVDLWGDTGGGKTVTLKIATSIWADPKEGAYIIDAKSTINSMEVKMNALNSLPVMIDDFSQVNSHFGDDFSSFIYFLAAGSGKGRAKADLSLRESSHWKNCSLVNAERSLISESTQGGAINRVIDIEVEKDIYPEGTVQSIIDTIHENYGWAGEEFIAVIRNIGIDEIKGIQKKYQDELKKRAELFNENKEFKQILPMSIILTADELSEKYLFQDGIRLEINDCYKLTKGRDEVSEHARAYSMLNEVVAANPSRFDDQSNMEQWGIWDEHDKNLVKIYANSFGKIMKEAGFQAKAFLSWATKKGMVDVDKKGNPKIVTKIGSHCVRCVFLHLNKEETDEEKEIEIDISQPFSC